jgi:hypothetical protein
MDQSEGRERSEPSDKQEAFNEFIDSTLVRKAELDIQGEFKNDKAKSDHFQKHLFFVTMHMKTGIFPKKDVRSTYVGNPIFQAYKAWYLAKCEEAMGWKFNKMINHQPFSIAFLDVEGTRYARAPSTFQIPHIHALFLAGSRNTDQFIELYESGKMKRYSDPRISGIDIQRFSDDGRGTGPLTSYAAKLARGNLNLNGAKVDMDFEFYPDVAAHKYELYRSETTARKQHRQHSRTYQRI